MAKQRPDQTARQRKITTARRWRQRRREDLEFMRKERERFAAYRAANRQRIRANQNAKNARIAAHYRPTTREAEERRTAGISLVTKEQVVRDHTRWQGPGMRREQELERQADELLSKIPSDSSPKLPILERRRKKRGPIGGR